MVQLDGEEHHTGSDPNDDQADTSLLRRSVRLGADGSRERPRVRRPRSGGLRSSVMRVRRVVTGHDADGKAVVASDTEVDGLRPALTPGSEFHRLWGADEAPHFPDDGTEPEHHAYFPPVGGFRFGLFAVPPGTVSTSSPPTTSRRRSPSSRRRCPGSRRTSNPTRRACTRPTRSTSRSCSRVRCGWSSTTASRSTCARATPSCRTAPVTPGATTATRRRAWRCSSIGAHHAVVAPR